MRGNKLDVFPTERQSTREGQPDITVLSLKTNRDEATQFGLQMEPSTAGRGAEGVYRLGLWGCTGERFSSVFSIQPKSSETSSSLLSAAS